MCLYRTKYVVKEAKSRNMIPWIPGIDRKKKKRNVKNRRRKKTAAAFLPQHTSGLHHRNSFSGRGIPGVTDLSFQKIRPESSFISIVKGYLTPSTDL